MGADKTMHMFSKVQIVGALSVTWLLAIVFTHFLRPVILPPVLNLEVEKEEDLIYGPWSNKKTFTEQGQSNGGELEEKEMEEEAWSYMDACKFVLVESIPEDLPYLSASPAAQPLIQSWMELLDSAQESVHVASYYWSLTGLDIGINDSSSRPGEELLEKLETLLAQNVSLTVATSDPTLALNSTDLEVLVGKGAQVRKIPMKHLTQGVLHTKFWIVDMKHVYLGSANMDWRSLTQASPPVLCPKGRTRDLDALLSLIRDAKDFFYASVMEYFPTSRFQHPFKYWPVIDNALREAAFNRHVPIRLLISCGKNSDPSMFPYLRSLQAFTNPQANITIEVKIFIIPEGNHSNIPFSRVSHSKYAVTEKKAYVGTSNWSEDYFTNTAGVGVIVNQSSSDPQHPAPTIQDKLRSIFERDWQSPYAISLEKLPGQQDCVWHA
ncbi:5'-3' exonuclease PLD4 isoform X2 [Gracilinanus agilis]|uniref:5'-3' exonuclease PLD4 isoform X2 n=1 Tax=Gracilinanus agilis TaxID=191870 RepID=UPI001CFD745B|nr:5'-3' exonuclease PLD4 isoform X2 [Gracilinanus agilis]